MVGYYCESPALPPPAGWPIHRNTTTARTEFHSFVSQISRTIATIIGVTLSSEQAETLQKRAIYCGEGHTPIRLLLKHTDLC